MAEKITATEDLFLNKDRSAVVTEGPEAAFLLVRAGKQVPTGYAHLVPKDEPAPKPKAKPKRKPAAKRKTATKEVKPGEDK